MVNTLLSVLILQVTSVYKASVTMFSFHQGLWLHFWRTHVVSCFKVCPEQGFRRTEKGAKKAYTWPTPDYRYCEWGTWTNTKHFHEVVCYRDYTAGSYAHDHIHQFLVWGKMSSSQKVNCLAHLFQQDFRFNVFFLSTPIVRRVTG